MAAGVQAPNISTMNMNVEKREIMAILYLICFLAITPWLLSRFRNKVPILTAESAKNAAFC